MGAFIISRLRRGVGATHVAARRKSRFITCLVVGRAQNARHSLLGVGFACAKLSERRIHNKTPIWKKSRVGQCAADAILRLVDSYARSRVAASGARAPSRRWAAFRRAGEFVSWAQNPN